MKSLKQLLKCPLDLCDGSGIIPEDVEDGEGHTMRGVGERKCPHTNRNHNGLEETEE